MNITREQKALIKSRKLQLDNIKLQLKDEFVGIDDIIDEIISAIEPWYLIPDMQKDPYVVNLWGLTGVGKSSIISRIAELLDYKDKYLKFDMGQYANGIEHKIKDDLDEQLRNFNGERCILVFDEFQLARTIDEVGSEMDSIRFIWELLDTGKYTAKPNKFYIACDFLRIIDCLKQCLKHGVEIKNGKIVKNYKLYDEVIQRNFENSSAERYFQATEKSKKKVKATDKDKHLIRLFEDYREDLNELLPDNIYGMDALEQFLNEFDGQGIIVLLEDLIKEILNPTEIDLSKSIVFVLGNLDEVYKIHGDVNPDEDADTFHRNSKRITLPEIKQALHARFRSEQVARLGNNHIIYPSFSSKTFKQLIELKLNNYKAYIFEKYKLKIEFDLSVNKILYKEGVYPTQGTRPLFTTIKLFIDSYTAKFLNDIIQKCDTTETIHWKYVKKHHQLEYLDKNGQILLTKKYKIQTKLEDLRKSKKNEEQAHTAVHESGHAILASLLFRIIPKEIVSQTANHDSGGYCRLDMDHTGLTTKQFIIDDVTINLGGLIAERLIFGDAHTSNGVYTDLMNATSIAITAMKRYGMGSEPLSFQVPDKMTNDYFFNYQNAEDEAKKLVVSCYKKGYEVLERNKLLLLKMSKYLSTHSKMKKKLIKNYVVEYSKENWVRSEGFINYDQYYNFKKVIDEQLEKMEAPLKVELNGTGKLIENSLN